MKKLFIRVLTVCVPVLLCVFTGCGAIDMRQFNAEDISGDLTFREDFLKANRTYGAVYWNGEEDPAYAQSYEYDKTSPKFRTYIITEKSRLDEIFSVYPGIDLKKEMVVMYAFTSIYNGRKLKITSITLNNKSLEIEFRYARKMPGVLDGSEPIGRFLVLKMDKLDINTVKFTLLNPRG